MKRQATEPREGKRWGASVGRRRGMMMKGKRRKAEERTDVDDDDKCKPERELERETV